MEAIPMTFPLACFLFLSCLGLASLAKGTQNEIILATSILPCLICLLAIIIRRNKDYFSPLWMLFYMVFIGSFLKAYYLVSFEHSTQYKRVILADLDLDILLPGALVLTLGTLAAILGYMVIPTRRANDQVALDASLYSLSGTRYFGLFALFVGTTMFAWFFQSLGLWEQISSGIISAKRVHEETVGVAPRGATLGYLRMGAQTLPQIALILHATNLMLRRAWPTKVDFLLLLALGFLSLLLPFLTSARLEMLYLFVFLMIIFHYVIKRLTIFHCAIAVVLLFSLLAVLGQLRKQSNPNFKGESGIQLSILDVLEATIARGYFMGIDKTSVIVDAVPQRIDYLYGKSLFLFLLGPVPRSYWPEKPVIRIGLFVGQEVFQRDNKSGTPPGFVGELYLNFGHLAVVIGMFIFGLIYGLLYQQTVMKKLGPLRVIVYSTGSMFLSFSLLTGDMTNFMSQTFRYGFCLLLGILIIKLSEKRLSSKKLNTPV